MFVRVEKVEQVSLAPAPVAVRVHSPVGTAVVSWRGDPEQANGRHHVEWTVDEDLLWERNVQLSVLAEPGLGQDGSRVVLRGRIDSSDLGTAVLEMGGSLVMFDLVLPLPASIAAAWVELRVEAAAVSLWPFQV
ncbi:hypothetical protein [Streptomyces sp. NPDC002855]|uniref:hypothetical protein n=1 Tax=Streptomyces sp. NPDC002855 TaxID=3154437 RepID=UPI003321D0C3